MSVPAESPVRMRLFGELERASRPKPVARKLDKYCGHFLRILKKKEEVELGAIVVCHHDPRRDISGRARQLGDGAAHLAESIRKELASGRYSHYEDLKTFLKTIDPSLDIGRLVIVQDWDVVESRGIAAHGYALTAHTKAGGAGETFDVDLYDVAREFDRFERRLRAYVHAVGVSMAPDGGTA